MESRPTVDLVLPHGITTTIYQAGKEKRTIKIFAAMLDRALGDFLTRNLYAAAVRMLFETVKLTVYYRD